jgi:HJR/Mrr/RecB family endonuclease
MRCVAQVENDAASVGLEAVQELVAAAAVDGRHALFFTAGSYAEDAEAFAERSGVTLFVYDAVTGTLDGANELGRAAVLDGLK